MRLGVSASAYHSVTNTMPVMTLSQPGGTLLRGSAAGPGPEAPEPSQPARAAWPGDDSRNPRRRIIARPRLGGPGQGPRGPRRGGRPAAGLQARVAAGIARRSQCQWPWPGQVPPCPGGPVLGPKWPRPAWARHRRRVWCGTPSQT